ncbi:MAG TPA: MlaD family protein [Verrucomicrobiales bacterium]|nr:MlaD family protein [Verrucomicrobiales bacterium]
MIESENKRVEWFVGLFVFLGLLLLGILVVTFGKFQDRFADKYTITVTFPEASGLSPGASVRLGGAHVGAVASLPKLNPTYDSVTVDLGIFDEIRIPEGSRFLISRTGLLGDAYVNISPPASPSGRFLGKNITVEGDAGTGLTDLQDSAAELSNRLADAIADMRRTLDTLNTTFQKFDERLLSDENTARISTILENLESSTESLGKTTDRFETFLDEGKGALESAREAFQKTSEVADGLKPAAEELGPAIAELQPAIAELRVALQSTRSFVDSLEGGRGLLSSLVHDEAMRDDASAFFSNLRQHGVLFYRDRDSQSAGQSSTRDRRTPREPPHRR